MSWAKATKNTSTQATAPIDRATAKLWIKVETDVTADDDLIDDLVEAARDHIEKAIGIVFFTQTQEDVLDAWPVADVNTNIFAAFKLLRFPVQSVEAVKYYDSSGVEQTLSSDQYIVDLHSKVCRIAPASGATWPTIQNRMNAIKIEYTAGYATTAEIPRDLINAIKLLMTYDYDRRTDGVKRFPTQVEHILGKHHIYIT